MMDGYLILKPLILDTISCSIYVSRARMILMAVKENIGCSKIKTTNVVHLVSIFVTCCTI